MTEEDKEYKKSLTDIYTTKLYLGLRKYFGKEIEDSIFSPMKEIDFKTTSIPVNKNWRTELFNIDFVLEINEKNVIKVGPYYRDLNQNALLKDVKPNKVCNKCNQEIKERALFNSVYIGCLC